MKFVGFSVTDKKGKKVPTSTMNHQIVLSSTGDLLRFERDESDEIKSEILSDSEYEVRFNFDNGENEHSEDEKIEKLVAGAI